MFQALAYSLPFALAIALSPLPIALSISVLLSSQPKNAISFLLGWSVGILVIGFFVFVIPGLDTDRGEPSQLAGWLRLVVGTGLVVLGIKMWVGGLKDKGAIEEPKLLSKLDNSSLGKILITGFTLSALNPKNLLLTLAGASYIDAYVSTLIKQSLVLLVFSIIASSSVGAPIVAYHLFSKRADSVLATLKNWLLRNNNAIVGTFLIVLGLIVAINGLLILYSFL